MKKRMKIVLTGSLLLNVLLIGVIGGHVYKRLASHPWHEVKQELSPETRNHVGRVFQQAFRDIRPLGDEARKQRAKLVKILTAKEFDAEAFDKAASEISDIRGEMKALKIQATKEVAQELSLEERRKMADRLAKMAGGGHERKVKRDRRPRSMRPPKPDQKPE